MDPVADPNVFSDRTVETYQLFAEGYTHAKNLEVRLQGILFLLENALINGPRITAPQLERLWDILIVKSVIPGDQNAFFRFFRRVLQEKDWLDSSLVRQLFEQKFEQNLDVITEISLDYFNCVQNMFLQINEFDNSITIIKHQVEEKKSSDGVFHSKGFKITKNNWKNDKKNGSWLGSGKGWSSSLNQNSNAVAGSKPKLEFRVHV